MGWTLKFCWKKKGFSLQVQLVPYKPDHLDESVLWSESKEVHDGYRAIRMINNIRLNVDAFHGDKKSGGIQNGTTIVLWQWNKGDNQIWKIVPYCKFVTILGLKSWQILNHFCRYSWSWKRYYSFSCSLYISPTVWCDICRRRLVIWCCYFYIEAWWCLRLQVPYALCWWGFSGVFFIPSSWWV